MMYRRFLILLLWIKVSAVTAFVAQQRHSTPLSKYRSPSHQHELQMWSNSDNIEGTDRIKSCVPYLLPLLDGDHFGIYIYNRIPLLGTIDDYLLNPIQNFYQAIPFAPIVFFLALTLGTRGNMSMSRAVRFNAQQAAIIDVALVFPELIAGSMQDSDLPRALLEPCSNFVYYAYMTMVLYSVSSNLRGQKPNQIPWISEAAELAVGPF